MADTVFSIKELAFLIFDPLGFENIDPLFHYYKEVQDIYCNLRLVSHSVLQGVNSIHKRYLSQLLNIKQLELQVEDDNYYMAYMDFLACEDSIFITTFTSRPSILEYHYIRLDIRISLAKKDKYNLILKVLQQQMEIFFSNPNIEPSELYDLVKGFSVLEHCAFLSDPIKDKLVTLLETDK